MDHGVNDGREEAVEHAWMSLDSMAAYVGLDGKDELFDDFR